MTARRPAAEEQSGSATPSEPRSDDTPRQVTDARSMRALAHPVRLALIEVLAREGPLTATQAAELLDDSPGNMSWHLQTLAKYGYVEEAGGGRGRSRPWQMVSTSHRFDASADDSASAAAEDALEAMFQERTNQRLREWLSSRHSYPLEWRDAAFSNLSVSYLTADEMEQLGDDITELLQQYKDRTRDKSKRPKDARPVQLVAFGHPLTPTPSGN